MIRHHLNRSDYKLSNSWVSAPRITIQETLVLHPCPKVITYRVLGETTTKIIKLENFSINVEGRQCSCCLKFQISSVKPVCPSKQIQVLLSFDYPDWCAF